MHSGAPAKRSSTTAGPRASASQRHPRIFVVAGCGGPCHTDRAVTARRPTLALPILLACAWGCTAPNGAYDEPTDGRDPSTGPSATSATGDASTSRTDSGPHETTSGHSGDNDSGPPPPMTTEPPDDTGTSESDSGPECESPIHPITIELFQQGAAVDHSKGCDSEVALLSSYMVAGGVLDMIPCGNETCTMCMPFFDQLVDLGGSAAFPPGLSGCGYVRLFETINFEGDCVWSTLEVFQAGTKLPQYVASNVDTTEFASAKATPIEGCTDAEGCDGLGLGPVGILFEGDLAVEPGGAASVPVVGTQQYFVQNYMSEVNEECEFHVAWTAEIEQ